MPLIHSRYKRLKKLKVEFNKFSKCHFQNKIRVQVFASEKIWKRQRKSNGGKGEKGQAAKDMIRSNFIRQSHSIISSYKYFKLFWLSASE